MPRTNIPPLVNGVPIVNPATGAPSPQFIQIWQQLFGNVDVNFEDAVAMAAAIAALEASVTTLQTDVSTLQTDVIAAELNIIDLQASAVPPGGALGDVLTKDSGTDYDMSWQPPSGGGGGAWTIALDTVITTPVSEIDVGGMTGANDIMVLMNGVTASVSDNRMVQFSADNGATFFSTSGDYRSLAAGGTAGSQIGVLMGSAATTAIFTGCILQAANTTSSIKGVSSIGGTSIGVAYLFTGSSLPINAVRIKNRLSGNLNGGSIVVAYR